MAHHFAKDRFDEVPADLKRVGAHRAPVPPGRGWSLFLWAALATLVLVTAGIVGLTLLGDRLNFADNSTPAASASESVETPTAVATIDPDAMVTVLNGTETRGLATEAIEKLNEAGWTQSITPGNASATDVETTTVYYADPSQEGAARGLAEGLGVGNIQMSTQFQIPAEEGEEPIMQLTVVLGSDFAAR
ncbi:LytR C-terminal domain-containing protein [Mycetocola miduiensis]|uniref:LytR cell envelope-related transcriptional attenuator n=1 Tax=Mycetocola miduiensis TaxID=995034 RepID=A0A1I5DUP1_9MICO|nr:LytR C-terminal domain-containing protein [Mycetocola miduiensis]SFO02917.1 LytR cell envelope-related transcriptional attenuator [Mycetocola miduiensis]